MSDTQPPLRELVGHVMVDSGTVVLGDPAYVMTQDAFDDVMRKKVRYETDLASALAVFDPQEVEPGFVVSRTQWGDGSYPVYADYNPQGELMALTIRFDEDEDEDDDVI